MPSALQSTNPTPRSSPTISRKITVCDGPTALPRGALGALSAQVAESLRPEYELAHRQERPTFAHEIERMRCPVGVVVASADRRTGGGHILKFIVAFHNSTWVTIVKVERLQPKQEKCDELPRRFCGSSPHRK